MKNSEFIVGLVTYFQIAYPGRNDTESVEKLLDISRLLKRNEDRKVVGYRWKNKDISNSTWVYTDSRPTHFDDLNMAEHYLVEALYNE